MRFRPIYLDCHATTPVDPRVAELMVQVMTTNFGNPHNRGHFFGDEAADIVQAARIEVSQLVNSSSENVVFLRSATVAASGVIASAVKSNASGSPLRVASTTVEHRAVLDALSEHESAGEIGMTWLPVDARAQLSIETVRSVLDKGCDLLCVMAANNEVGTVYPIAEIASLARDADVSLLVDATQAAGHLPIDLDSWGITYLLMSAHKMYGPKGIAALVSGREANADFRDLERAEGTPNVPGIAGFGEACRLCREEMLQTSQRVSGLRDRLERLLGDRIDGLVVNGDRTARLDHNLHVSIPGIPNEAVVARLSQSVALSTGSACQWGTDQPSHVLQAMGLSDELQESAIRIGLGKTTSQLDVDRAAELIAAAAEDVRRKMLSQGIR
jgi:cysteine desulfurase